MTSLDAFAHFNASRRNACSSVTLARAVVSQARARSIAAANSARLDGGANIWRARIETAVTSISFDSIGGRVAWSGQCPSAAWRRFRKSACASVAASGG